MEHLKQKCNGIVGLGLWLLVNYFNLKKILKVNTSHVLSAGSPCRSLSATDLGII